MGLRKCSMCKGKGKLKENTCPNCSGSGWIQ